MTDKFPAPSASEVNIIIAVDAGIHHKKYWDKNMFLQRRIFDVADINRRKVNVQLLSSSGQTQRGLLPGAETWYSSVTDFSDVFAGITGTFAAVHINRVLSHALQEVEKKKVAAVFLVADSFEENVEDAKKLARQLNKKGITLFVLDDTEHSTARQEGALLAFTDIAEAAEGYYAGFSTANLNVLVDYFKIAILEPLVRSQSATICPFPRTPERNELESKGLPELNGPK